MTDDQNTEKTSESDVQTDGKVQQAEPRKQKEIGGRKGPEPTRYGDWEKNGIISDF